MFAISHPTTARLLTRAVRCWRVEDSHLEFGPWRGLLVCSVETRLDAKTGLDMSVEAAGRSACATRQR